MNAIADFGRNSFVTWTTGLIERITMPDEVYDYICSNCGKCYWDGQSFCCKDCGTLICKKCGSKLVTIKEYDEAMRVNQEND